MVFIALLIPGSPMFWYQWQAWMAAFFDLRFANGDVIL